MLPYSRRTSLTNGTAPFTYAWSTGATTSSVTGLGAGTYTVTVTDALNQTATGSATLSVNPLTLTIGECIDNGLGQLSATPAGGMMPYSYLWDANAGSSTNDTVFGLANGSYDVTVTDQNNCTVVGTGTISGSTPVCDTCALPAGRLTRMSAASPRRERAVTMQPMTLGMSTGPEMISGEPVTSSSLPIPAWSEMERSSPVSPVLPIPTSGPRLGS